MQSAREIRQGRPIILAIEEPELYIHPQSQRLVYKVLKEFSGIQSDDTDATGNDQVLYTTHSPTFVDVGRYEQIAAVRKENAEAGTTIKQCELGVLGTSDERKGFKLLTSFSLKHNEIFFSRYTFLVEGPEDEIAVIATSRKLRKFSDLPDEIRVSVAIVGNKEQLPKFQKVLNAFDLKYSVLLEMDNKSDADPSNKTILDLIGGNIVSKLPVKLEATAAIGKEHFKDVFEAKVFFSNPNNINKGLETVVNALYPADITNFANPKVLAQAAIAKLS
jgi:putative ATP-dependent endonuclease of OLD family